MIEYNLFGELSSLRHTQKTDKRQPDIPRTSSKSGLCATAKHEFIARYEIS